MEVGANSEVTRKITLSLVKYKGTDFTSLQANDHTLLYINDDGTIQLNSLNSRELRNLGFQIENDRVKLTYIPREGK